MWFARLASPTTLDNPQEALMSSKTIYTYSHFSSFCEALNLSVPDVLHKEQSDQYVFQTEFSYPTYGGGGAGIKNGHYGCTHTEETKRRLAELRRGKSPSNKGIPNPQASVRMKIRNPMHDPIIAKKVGNSKRGKIAHNRITETESWNCKWCGKTHTTIARKTKRKALFCGKSCAASYSNTHRVLRRARRDIDNLTDTRNTT